MKTATKVIAYSLKCHVPNFFKIHSHYILRLIFIKLGIKFHSHNHLGHFKSQNP